MKVQDILAESNKNYGDNIDEAPMGFLSKAGRTIASKLGSKSSAVKLDVGNRANEIFDAFKDWSLRTGMDLKAVSVKQLGDWLKKQNLPVPNLGGRDTTYDLTNSKSVTDIFTRIANAAYAAAPSSTAQNLGGRYGAKVASAAAGRAPAAKAGRSKSAPAPEMVDFEALKQSVARLTPDQRDELANILIDGYN